MSRIKRVLFVFVPCFMLFFSTLSVTSAFAATTPYSSLQSYWDRYNLPGKTYGNPITKPAPAPTTPAPTTPPPASSPANPAPATPTPAPYPSTPSPTTTPATTGLSADESLMLSLVNQERVKAGLPQYSVDMGLVNLARQKSQDMVQNNYFNHTSPTYGSAYDMEKKAGVTARVMGAENIAKAATTERAHQLLMNSSGHKANILNPLHDTIGVGIAKTSSGVTVTQLFEGN
jgi:uncharacterized protein YkwD